MTSKERVRRAMRTGWERGSDLPDRVPVFCQLSVGHYFLHSGVNPIDIWYRSEGYAEALIRLARRYRFDGILVNLPGRDPDFERHVERMERGEAETVILWKNGNRSVIPQADNPHYLLPDGRRHFPSFDEIDPNRLHYVEPWDITEITYPYTWGFDESPRPPEDFFPDYHLRTLEIVRERVGEELSVHAEVFSPFSQFCELLEHEEAFLAIVDDRVKVHACLESLTLGAADLAKRQAGRGADAVLISSAFAGASFISRSHYVEFVLNYEQKLIREVLRAFPDLPVYTHTCGSIGDRLDLMLKTGTRGIDTLDPPPLGTVELEDAKRFLAGKAFIKGNIDPVNTLLEGSRAQAETEARRKLRVGKPGGGYILSSACSVSPATPPGNLEVLVEVVEEEGHY